MNASKWKHVQLRDVVVHRKEFIEIDDLTKYKRCRVQLHARGVVLRDEVEGGQIKTKRQQVCHENEFLVAEIDAKMGGFGLVPPELTGAVVSSHYFLFTPQTNKLDPHFLGYYSQTASFQDQVVSRGSTNYAAIRPSHVLGYTIPLPPIDVQRRIVARLHDVSAKVGKVRDLSERSESECRAFLKSKFAEVTGTAKRARLGDVAPLIRRAVEPKPGNEYLELGVRSFGKGTFHKPSIDYMSLGSKKLYRIEPGDLVFNNVFAWEGAIAVAQPEDVGRVGSHRFITCVPKGNRAIAEFLWFYFLTSEGLERIGEASPGGAGRNRTLGLTKLANIKVPIPDLEKQQQFCELLERMRGVDESHQATRKKINALLPSILDRTFKGEL
jgi:type I restriction enzyme, S subunit